MPKSSKNAKHQQGCKSFDEQRGVNAICDCPPETTRKMTRIEKAADKILRQAHGPCDLYCRETCKENREAQIPFMVAFALSERSKALREAADLVRETLGPGYPRLKIADDILALSNRKEGGK